MIAPAIDYYGFAVNAATLNKFAYTIERKWFKWLNRRSQRKSFSMEEFKERLNCFPLPKPRIVKGYTWIYATGMLTCLKSRMREIRKSGSVRGWS